MHRNLRISAILALVLAAAVSTFGQERTTWRTAADIHEGARGVISGVVLDANDARNELTLDPADERSGNVRVVTDAVTTQYNGFGGVINGQPEIFIGSKGFPNVRIGDRIEVRGVGTGTPGTVAASYVTLLGRSVSASQVGVGQTRSPNTVSTPTPIPSGSTSADRTGRVEGVVQQVNAADNRVVIATDARQILTVRTSRTTPVYYQGDAYTVRDLEVGDRIRIEPDSGGTAGNELYARSIDVVRSRQEGGDLGTTTVASISGRVTRLNRTANYVYVSTGRGPEITVDLSNATDSTGRRVRATDLQVNDQVDISGTYSSNTDDQRFLATTVRFNDADVFAQGSAGTGGPQYPLGGGEFVTATIYGTVMEALGNAPTLGVRDQQGRIVRILVTDDFVIRTKAGNYATADRLKENDAVVIKAYRDPEGEYIAQTIRMR
jgi:hypothetical protein